MNHETWMLLIRLLGIELIIIGVMILAGLRMSAQMFPRRPFDAPWDGYRGKRRMPIRADRDWVMW